MKLDITSKRIIQKIVNRQHVSKDLEEVNKAVFKKIRGKDKLNKDTLKNINDCIKNCHQQNFIMFLAVQSGKI